MILSKVILDTITKHVYEVANLRMALLDIDVFVLTEVPISIPFRYYLLLSLQKNAISAFLRGRRDPIYRVPSGVGGPTLVNREGH